MCAKIDKNLENGNTYTSLDIHKLYFLRKFAMLVFQSSNSCGGCGKNNGLKKIFFATDEISLLFVYDLTNLLLTLQRLHKKRINYY